MSKPNVRRKVIPPKARKLENELQKKGKPLRPSPFILLISLCLIAATLSVFWPVKNHEFINLDDDTYVSNNPNVKAGLTSKGVIWAFTTFHASNWHPLTWLSHMLDCELFGLNPGWHHLTNLLFHIVNTLLLFLVLNRMTGAPWGSSFVAALFALHPLHVESVAWVAERKDVLSTFFWVLTMWAYVRYVERPGIHRYLVVLIFFVMGLMSKPMLVSLPFVLLLLDYWPLGRFPFWQMKPNHLKSSAFPLFLEKVPFFILSGVSCLLTYFAQEGGGTVKTLQFLPLGTRIANALVSYVNYIIKMVWPYPLAIYYPYPDQFHLWQVAGASLFLVSVSFLVIRFVRRYPYFLVGWLWYLGTLVPVIGLVQVGMQSMADRYTYVPFIGLSIMIVKGLPDILMKWRYRKMVLAVSASILLSIFIVMTRVQIQYWQNGVTLFEHTLNVVPNNFLGHHGLGFVLARQGRIEEAIFHYKEALRIDPFHVRTQNNLGVILAQQGKLNEAAAHFYEALRIQPGSVEAQYNLGALLAQQGKTQEAISHFSEAVKIKPDLSEAHLYLGLAHLMMGNRDFALREYQILKAINPTMANTLYQKMFK